MTPLQKLGRRVAREQQHRQAKIHQLNSLVRYSRELGLFESANESAEAAYQVANYCRYTYPRGAEPELREEMRLASDPDMPLQRKAYGDRVVRYKGGEYGTGYVTVLYPKLLGKDNSWRHLLRNPPEGLIIFPQENPWRKCHGHEGWSWYARCTITEANK